MKKLSLFIENLENFSDANLNFSDSAALRNEIFPEEPEKIEKIQKDSESALKEDFSELKARFDSANLTKTEIKTVSTISIIPSKSFLLLTFPIFILLIRFPPQKALISIPEYLKVSFFN